MKLTDKRTVLETRPFKVEELRFELDGGALPAPYHRLRCSDWVNVLPVTSDGRALLIRQFRAGALKEVLEVPGGMIDADEKDPTLAATRELEEETGCTSQRVLPLGVINPNPAIQDNRVHMFLALNVMPNPNRRHFPDDEERIAIELVPTRELDGMIRTGRIDHALCALTIMLAGKYVPIS